MRVIGAIHTSAIDAVVGVIGVIFVLAGAMSLAWAYFKASAGRNLIAQQDSAINMLKITVDELRRQNNEQQSQLDQQAVKMAVLEQLVTQTAKVDQLTEIILDGFEQLGVKPAQPK